MNRPRATVLGASGQIGVFLVPALLASGYQVTAVSRSARPGWCPPLPGLNWIRSARAASEAGAEPGFLLSAGPLALALECLGDAPHWQRVVAFSTTSVLSKAASPDPAERKLIDGIVRDEGHLARRCDELGIGLCLLRPTLVYGCGMDRNISLLASWIRRFGVLPISRDARGLRAPVHAQDLAHAALAALLAPQAAGLETPLCGGSRLSYRRMAERVFAALDKAPRLLELPAGLLRTAVASLRWLGMSGGLGPEMVRRQAVDLVFDDSPARDLLAWRPREFRPAFADLHLPDVARLSIPSASPAERK